MDQLGTAPAILDIQRLMILKSILIVLLLFLSAWGIAQEPPEQFCIRFKDAQGAVIYPQLTLIETSIQPFKHQKNSPYWDDVVFVQDTLVLDSITRQQTSWGHVDTTGYYFYPNASSHHLSEEIQVIAIHQNQTMLLTFIGQGKLRLDRLGKDLQPSNSFDVLFKKGHFLHVRIDANTTSTILYQGRVAEGFEMLNNALAITPNNNICGFSANNQLLPIQALLASNRKEAVHFSYLSFLFKNNTPVGFALISNKIHKAYRFNKKYQKAIQQYCRQQRR